MAGSRTAYLTLQNQEFRAHEGDTIGQWTVVSIQSRAVELRGTDGTTKELQLNRRAAKDGIGQATSTPVEPLQSFTDSEDAPAVIAPPPPKKIRDGVYRLEPKFVEDKDVPAGYVKKRSLFGDYLIKEGHEENAND
ncbi:hypothetical protein [Endothiovibrio diazotrophicus]